MTPLALSIEMQARKLSAAERERLAERLLARMEDECLPAVDKAWVAEAERRLSAWKRKKTNRFLLLRRSLIFARTCIGESW